MAVIERSKVIDEVKYMAVFQKAGALSANDLAGACVVGSLAIDTTNGKLYICTATNGSSTSTWVSVGSQT
jgi:hypothetical protein